MYESSGPEFLEPPLESNQLKRHQIEFQISSCSKNVFGQDNRNLHRPYLQRQRNKKRFIERTLPKFNETISKPAERKGL